VAWPEIIERRENQFDWVAGSDVEKGDITYWPLKLQGLTQNTPYPRGSTPKLCIATKRIPRRAVTLRPAEREKNLSLKSYTTCISWHLDVMTNILAHEAYIQEKLTLYYK